MSEAQPDPQYAGDLSPAQAFELLTERANAVMIDVRTTAEWAYVGLPDLSGLGKDVLRLNWKVFPAMEVHAGFVADLQSQGLNPDQPLLFLCRSGIRSKDAAIAMTAAGYQHCYNIAQGFEGDKDPERHRGRIGGWKAHGLPWLQD